MISSPERGLSGTVRLWPKTWRPSVPRMLRTDPLWSSLFRRKPLLRDPPILRTCPRWFYAPWVLHRSDDTITKTSTSAHTLIHWPPPCGSVPTHLWAAHKELPARQEMVDGLVVQVLGGNDHLHHLLHQVASDLLQGDVRDVLHRDDHGVNSQRLHGSGVVSVLHGDLRRKGNSCSNSSPVNGRRGKEGERAEANAFFSPLYAGVKVAFVCPFIQK